MATFSFNDIGLRTFHPEIHLTRELTLRLQDRLGDFYHNQSRKPDQLSFSSTEKKMAAVTAGMMSVSDIFDDAPPVVVNRVFEIMNRLITTANPAGITTFDLVLSALYAPPLPFAEAGVLNRYDFLGSKFLRSIDFTLLGGQDFTTGINWVFQREERTYTLKFEPYAGHPDEIFLDMVVQYPEQQISVLEMKSAVEDELAYLERDVVGFLDAAATRGRGRGEEDSAQGEA